MTRIADSMLIMLAKGQRASQAEVVSDRLAPGAYYSWKDTFYYLIWRESSILSWSTDSRNSALRRTV